MPERHELEFVISTAQDLGVSDDRIIEILLNHCDPDDVVIQRIIDDIESEDEYDEVMEDEDERDHRPELITAEL